MIRIFRFFCAAVFAIGLSSAAQAQTLVFAAASLTDVMQDIGKAYQASTGKAVTFSFAGSMALAKQIQASGGADIFIAADSESMDYIDNAGLIAKASRKNLLGNDLVLIAPSDSKISLKLARPLNLAAALGGGRLAVANIDTVPAGRYAKAALMSLDAWNGVADHLAQGEDVRAALAFVTRGETPLGIVYATDARIAPKVRVVARFPGDSHPPIVYPAALTKDAKPEAAAFLTYLHGAQARAAFEKAGFTFLGGNASR